MIREGRSIKKKIDLIRVSIFCNTFINRRDYFMIREGVFHQEKIDLIRDLKAVIYLKWEKGLFHDP